MKRILALATLVLAIQLSFGQACGIYRIKYIGNIQTDSVENVKIKLPTPVYLHRLENESSELSFVEARIIGNKIELELQSHLTTPFDNAETLKTFYKSKSETLKIKLLSTKNGHVKETTIKLDWDSILITKIDDKKFGNLFGINLNDLKIE
ncbi:MAG: hypothetical protein K0S33_3376 [Bacteroidetes bacterium]|jgi:hypothetical protein|nr:hypothetical protein [Bacteroidota bacterium]